MSTRTKVLVLLLLVVAIAVGAVVNRGEDGGADTTSTSGAEVVEDFADPCTREELELLEPGVMTVGAAGPSELPWLAPGDPTPEGFEPAVVLAVAEFMHFVPEELRWVDVPREDVLASGPQGVDFAVGQLVPTAALDETMDFTESYYDVEQAVVTRTGTELADDVATLDELRASRLGAPAGPSHDTALSAIQPAQEVVAYESPADALAGLRAGDVDAVLIDYPTALQLLREDDAGVVLAGRLPAQGNLVWGFATAEGSTLRACLAAAIANVRQQSLDVELAQAWIEPEAPPLILE